VVISRTPLRVSFVGGGTDLPRFAGAHGGAVVTTTIDKYVHVIVTERFEPSIRVSYSRTEIVDRLDELEHELVREAMRIAGVRRKVEIVTIADVPAGTGLGSSSAVTVGVLNALFAYQGILKSAAELAAEACRIELDVLGKPIGRQDQYACAFGGLQLLCFGADGVVERRPIVVPPDQRRVLERGLVMFWTGGHRSADGILEDVSSAIDGPKVTAALTRMRDIALELYHDVGAGRGVSLIGERLHENWELKRSLAANISTPEIEELYDRALAAGAVGGKLLGAGGRGFLLFYVPRGRQANVRTALADLRELPFRMEPAGSRIVLVDR
jgi:D-glycero-alpha-D-manno-heptose-7-phosphate kinase